MKPLVTLIPAYKPDFLTELFLGLATQTHADFSVILSDDSPGGEITRQIRSGAFDALTAKLDLHVVDGPCQGPMTNIRHLLRMLDGQASMVHVHLDDDVIYPDFYRQHVGVHAAARPAISVSARWITRADGRPAAALPVPEFIEQSPQRVVSVDADALYASTVAVCQNWLGEMSNMVLSREGAREFGEGHLDGISYYGLGDVGVLLGAVRTTPIAFIRDHLSGFRSNPLQSSVNTQSFALKCGYLAWVALALAAERQGRISPPQVLRAIITTVERAVPVYANDALMGTFFDLVRQHAGSPAVFRDRFLLFWKQILSNDKDARSDPGGEVMFGVSAQGLAGPI